MEVFKMERYQSTYEKQVDYNLSESGVRPMKIAEVIKGVEPSKDLLALKLGYPWGNGSPKLRERIAKWYPGATAENVTVTNGGSEANYIAFWSLLESGDRAAVMIPNYMQTWHLGRAYGAGSDPFRLVMQDGPGGTRRWVLDLDSLDKAVTEKTKAILVTNPNNPTGAVLTEDEMDAIVRAARRANAWIVADEIYRGAELAGPTTQTFWGRYPKVIVTSGLSKAFGLPGLRVGWAAGPAKTIYKMWSYHDYTTLTPNGLGDHLGAIAMRPKRRDEIFARTRDIVRTQWPVLEKWARRHEDVLSWALPEAGAIAYFKFYLPGVSSPELFEYLLKEKSVLINTADHFGMPGKYVRVGYGYEMDRTLKGLRRIGEAFKELRAA